MSRPSPSRQADANSQTLKRELGLPGAVFMGLGSIVGTGVFVSIGVAAGVAGPSVILALVLAAAVASFNALSSAQLAASHPVSGGTYEYGYRYLTPWLGVTAGWTFLMAKTASAATAALGFSGYLLHLLGIGRGALVPVAVVASTLMTLLVLSGLRRSNRLNIAVVSVTIGSLTLFVVCGLPRFASQGIENLTPFFPAEGGLSAFFYATALMFVAYTGYARIATMGEEVAEPRSTIPRAIIITLLVSAVLYVAVAAVAIGAAGVEPFARAAEEAATPLEAAARALDIPALGTIVAFGAVTAMLGVLLNLILGLSRVLLAMGRNGDLPPVFARLTARGTPVAAVLAAGAAIAGLALLGSVETTWSFSAFTVLIYYAITNLAALRLPRKHRLYSPILAVCGLAGCLFLAVWVPPSIWVSGLALIGLGLIWHVIAQRIWGRRGTVEPL